jgi:anti-sigma factor RsiW
MDCKEFRELLDLYVDGELAPSAMASASVHSNECQPCRRTQRELAQLQHALKSVVRQHQPPADLVQAIRKIHQSAWPRMMLHSRPSRLLSSQTQGPGAFWHRKVMLPVPVVALLLLAFLITLVWLVLPRRPDQTSANNKAKREQVDSVRSQSPGDQTWFARFDHGERAAVFKVRLTK